MNRSITEIFNTGLTRDQQSRLKDCLITSVRYHKSSDALDVFMTNPSPLDYELFCHVTFLFQKAFTPQITFYITYDNPAIDIQNLHKYIRHFTRMSTEYECFNSCMPSFEEDKVILWFTDDSLMVNALQVTESLCAFMLSIGIVYDFQLRRKELLVSIDEKKVEIPVAQEAPQEKPKYRPRETKMEDYMEIALKDTTAQEEDITFKGVIFNIEEVTTKADKLIQTIAINDGTGSINIKRFENKRLSRDDMHEFKVNDYVQVFGEIIYDTYINDYICRPKQITKLEKKTVTDNEPNKRIELQAHTTMSEMDGICEVEDLVTHAFNMGHEAVAITDHAAVQAFAKAHNKANGLLKGSDRKFKIIYGCEMNMVDENLTIVRNSTDQHCDDLTYVAFDLETTGLSCFFDHIIEFGAVKIKDQTIIDRKQCFIKPPVPIPPFIQEKTNIHNENVQNAQTFAEAIDDILNWIGDAVLVAHNASFDYSFLNEELRRLGRSPLTNVVIDTLDFARAIHSDRRAYRLGNIARLYRITYDEEVAHRADYDAEVLAEVFLAMMRDARKMGAVTINYIQNLQTEKAFAKVRKNHVNVLVKNQQGMKTLYKLVTTSNTSSLALFGKANGKNGEEFLSEPRILRSVLQENRSDILLGSACFNSEVFELAANRSDEDLRNAISFYDFIEIQPLANYAPLITMHSIPDEERLKKVLRRIIDMARSLKKIVVATGDVHYLNPEDKQFRDIYIATQGVGGVRHPLYIYNDELRRRNVNPDQHFRSTREMLECFEWLDDPVLIEDMVITNPHIICNMIEQTQPVLSGTFPPIIEGSSEKLTNICFETARSIYGDPLPSIVEERLKRELKSIIDNGYSVVYYISHLLVKKSNDDGYLVGSRGSVGSSLVATMSGITEVNPLTAHYICPTCKHSEFLEDYDGIDGYDLPDKVCPKCGGIMKGNGHNIPFETFLGFKGDKVPDIDLNFSNEYQAKAHAFTKEVFGEDHVFRAGTIGTVAGKTAFGYVQGYCEEMGMENMRKIQKDYLSANCEGVKRTTGQHPGGIIVIPQSYDASDFTPVQYPANDPSSEWKTTHFDFHDIHDNVLKFDILGHVDPTAMRLLESISGIDPKTIPMNDPETMSIFSSPDALKLDTRIYDPKTGALGLPEFGTKITRGVLVQTKPKNFRDLVIISGLTHGTDVWAGNASDLVEQGIPLDEVIGCRDDIMTYLIAKGLESITAFTIMESVRKGKGLKPEWIEEMLKHDVPQWYVDSCLKIKYMFPKAHAVAYVLMAVRIAWFKVHYPHWFYIQFLTLRCDAYEIETMSKGIDAINNRMHDIQERLANRDVRNPVSQKEKSLLDTLEVCQEIYARGYRIGNIDLHHSKATEFCIVGDNTKEIIPPFVILDGLGENVARSIEKARDEQEFISKEDLLSRTQLSATLLNKLDSLGCLNDLQEKNQLSLF